MYVMRDERGAITAAFAAEQPFATEFLPMDNAELIAYLKQFEI